MDNEKIDMNVKKNNRPLLAHVCILMACVFWGLMSPLGKDAMMNGVDGICMVSFRVIGGAALFWLTSLFVKKECVPWRDRLLLALAGLFGLVFNQCCFTIGLNITSPINASIVTTRCQFSQCCWQRLSCTNPSQEKRRWA